MRELARLVEPRAVELVQALVEEGIKVKAACRHVAAFTGSSSRELYDAVVRGRG